MSEGDVTTAKDHYARSREISDTLRRYLIALNTGGVATVFAVAGALTSNGVNPSWAATPVAVFVLGLAITGLSLFLAKLKAIRRRDALTDGLPEPNYNKLIWRNATYDILALLVFLIAVLVGLWGLSGIRLPTSTLGVI